MATQFRTVEGVIRYFITILNPTYKWTPVCSCSTAHENGAGKRVKGF